MDKMPTALGEICTDWSVRLESLPDRADRIRFVQQHLPEVLFNLALFEELVERICRGNAYPDIRRTDAFDNEILLYLNPRRIFSLRMFFFGPAEFTPVHDHNAWGVTGTVYNPLTVVRYDRTDDRTAAGVARLEESRRRTLVPGETELTLPLDEGIHRTGSDTDRPVLMVSVYGSPIRRLHVNGFDIENQRVYPMVAPRMKKRRMAREVFKAMTAGADRCQDNNESLNPMDKPNIWRTGA